jgi:hypothetical protein
VRAGTLKSGLVLLLLSIARPASAERIAVDALPRGELPELPASRPSSVSGASASEGLWLSAGPLQGEGDQFGSMAIWDNPKAAEQFARGDYSYMTGQEPTSCFLVEHAHGEMQRRWPLSSMSHAQVTVHQPGRGSTARHPMYPTLHAVRVERLAMNGAGATLDVTDLWLDTRSKAMKVIERGRFALERVASVNPGATVFAARGEDAVHFVIAPSDKRWSKIRDRLGGNGIELERGAEQGTSNCSHATLSLRAPAGAGETATARLKVVTQMAPKSPDNDRSITAAVKRVLGPPANSSAENFSGGVTVRTLAVHVSAGRTRAGRPLSASVAFQWTKDLQKRDL